MRVEALIPQEMVGVNWLRSVSTVMLVAWEVSLYSMRLIGMSFPSACKIIWMTRP